MGRTDFRIPSRMKWLCLPALMALLLAGGCAGRTGLSLPPGAHDSWRSLTIYDTTAQRELDREELRARFAAADVVLLAESHGAPSSLIAGRILLEEFLAVEPRGALSLEMLSRDQQPLLDRFLSGEWDAGRFVAEAGVADWPAEGAWMDTYQPLLDQARDAGAPVAAANSPRGIVRKAWTEGPDFHEKLSAEEREFFTLPRATGVEAYRARFMEAMEEHEAMTGDNADDLFRAQRIWDATMAASIAGALEQAPKVLHIAGRFHIEHEGGIVLELRERRPQTNLLTVSLGDEYHPLEVEDLGVADLIVFPE